MLLELDAGERDDEPEELWRLVDVVAIACGGHAGTDASMARVIAACLPHQQLGAHPSYPDRARFGREPMQLSSATLEACVADQCASLARVASDHGRTIQWIKPHGALYHAAADDEDIARAVLRGACWSLGDSVIVIGPSLELGTVVASPWSSPPPSRPWSKGGAVPAWASAGGPSSSTMFAAVAIPPRGALAAIAAELGLRYAREGFADRRILADGSLVPRTEPDALITDPAAAATQVKSLVDVDIIALHADTPNALAIAHAVRAAVGATGPGPARRT